MPVADAIVLAITSNLTARAAQITADSVTPAVAQRFPHLPHFIMAQIRNSTSHAFATVTAAAAAGLGGLNWDTLLLDHLRPDATATATVTTPAFVTRLVGSSTAAAAAALRAHLVPRRLLPAAFAAISAELQAVLPRLLQHPTTSRRLLEQDAASRLTDRIVSAVTGLDARAIGDALISVALPFMGHGGPFDGLLSSLGGWLEDAAGAGSLSAAPQRVIDALAATVTDGALDAVRGAVVAPMEAAIADALRRTDGTLQDALGHVCSDAAKLLVPAVRAAAAIAADVPLDAVVDVTALPLAEHVLARAAGGGLVARFETALPEATVAATVAVFHERLPQRIAESVAAILTSGSAAREAAHASAAHVGARIAAALTPAVGLPTDIDALLSTGATAAMALGGGFSACLVGAAQAVPVADVVQRALADFRGRVALPLKRLLRAVADQAEAHFPAAGACDGPTAAISDAVSGQAAAVLAAAQAEAGTALRGALSIALSRLLRCAAGSFASGSSSRTPATAGGALTGLRKRRAAAAQVAVSQCRDGCSACVGSPCDALTVWPVQCHPPGGELCCDAGAHSIRIGAQQAGSRWCRSLPPTASPRRVSPGPASIASSPTPLPSPRVSPPQRCSDCAACHGVPCSGELLVPYKCHLCCDAAARALRPGTPRLTSAFCADGPVPGPAPASATATLTPTVVPTRTPSATTTPTVAPRLASGHAPPGGASPSPSNACPSAAELADLIHRELSVTVLNVTYLGRRLRDVTAAAAHNVSAIAGPALADEFRAVARSVVASFRATLVNATADLRGLLLPELQRALAEAAAPCTAPLEGPLRASLAAAARNFTAFAAPPAADMTALCRVHSAALALVLPPFEVARACAELVTHLPGVVDEAVHAALVGAVETAVPAMGRAVVARAAEAAVLDLFAASATRCALTDNAATALGTAALQFIDNVTAQVAVARAIETLFDAQVGGIAGALHDVRQALDPIAEVLTSGASMPWDTLIEQIMAGLGPGDATSLLDDLQGQLVRLADDVFAPLAGLDGPGDSVMGLPNPLGPLMKVCGVMAGGLVLGSLPHVDGVQTCRSRRGRTDGTGIPPPSRTRPLLSGTKPPPPPEGGGSEATKKFVYFK